MTLRLNTAEFAFESRLTNLATNTTLGTATRHDFAAITLTIPETWRRRFPSVIVEVTYRDAFAAARTITDLRIGIKLGSVAFSDTDNTFGAFANTGDHESGLHTIDVTDYFNTNFGADDTQTCQVGFAMATSVADNVTNITAKLVITYEFDEDDRIVVAQTADFDVADENNTPTTVTVAAGSYTHRELEVLIDGQLPDDIDTDWTFYWEQSGGAYTGKAAFDYPNSVFSITWNDTTLRNQLGFSADAVDWDSGVSGPFTGDNVVEADLQQLVVRTLRIPIQSHHTTLTDSHVEIGTTGGVNNAPANQIPALDSWLPTGSTIKQIWLEVLAHENDASTTDFSFVYQIDSLTEVTRGTIEQGLQTSCWFKDIIPLDFASLGLSTATAHAFKARHTIAAAARFPSIGAILHVTYTIDTTQASWIVDSLLLPVHDTDSMQAFFPSSSGEAERFPLDIEVQEPVFSGSITLMQSGVLIPFNYSQATTLSLVAGAAATRSYAILATQTTSGPAPIIHRIDHSTGFALSRGANRLTLNAYISANNVMSMVGGTAIINYKSAIHADGPNVHARTTIWHVRSSSGTSSLQLTASTDPKLRTPNIPEEAFRAMAIWARVYARRTGANAVTVSAEVRAGEFDGDGWRRHLHGTSWTLEMGHTELTYDFTNDFNLDPNESGKLAIETARDWRRYASGGCLDFQQLLVTYHAISYEVAGEVIGWDASSGDGSGIEVAIFDEQNELVTMVTTVVGGGFTATVYDDTVEYYAVAYEDATHKGRSKMGTAGVDTFDVVFTLTTYRMRGFDSTLGRTVFWQSTELDSNASAYTGPGPVTDIVVQNVIGRLIS